MEVARFEAKIVRGPAVGDCWIWIGALGNDGYGRFWVTRDGMDVMVRPSRYAVALATGEPVPPDLVAMHDRCDNPICVRAAWVGTSPPHVVLGTQADNLSSMGSKRRGGGQRPLWKHDGLTRAERVARSKALRDAVRTGWNGDAVRRALLVGGGRPTLFGADGMP
ncbi:hypothetical protein [Nocardia otitidiscaviarum]|uniref:hypothetical protein n=1 Tax=Nocardia otitidiscaviarum TaxID=1823 RepID=UPI0015590423|nr:hypothetical protein [Nocardia otitidiscaviarum]